MLRGEMCGMPVMEGGALVGDIGSIEIRKL